MGALHVHAQDASTWTGPRRQAPQALVLVVEVQLKKHRDFPESVTSRSEKGSYSGRLGQSSMGSLGSMGAKSTRSQFESSNPSRRPREVHVAPRRAVYDEYLPGSSCSIT